MTVANKEANAARIILHISKEFARGYTIRLEEGEGDIHQDGVLIVINLGEQLHRSQHVI